MTRFRIEAEEAKPAYRKGGRPMHSRNCLVVLMFLVCSALAPGKDKKQPLLPAVVLRAETVFVEIDPDAGTAADAPLANQTARDDVERALTNWGRFRFAINLSTADLVITVRKSDGKITQGTIGGVPTNNRPVIFQPSDSGVRIGGSHGTPAGESDPSSTETPNPSPQVEVGAAQDTFAVYLGGEGNVVNSSPVWRYTAKGALRSCTSGPAVTVTCMPGTQVRERSSGVMTRIFFLLSLHLRR